LSHRPSCPDPWEARRAGERAFENGFGSNPHRHEPVGYESYEDRRCREEAAGAWRRGYSSAEEREQERQAEESRRRDVEETYYEEEPYR
jgi:hypothetical protein